MLSSPRQKNRLRYSRERTLQHLATSGKFRNISEKCIFTVASERCVFAARKKETLRRICSSGIARYATSRTPFVFTEAPPRRCTPSASVDLVDDTTADRQNFGKMLLVFACICTGRRGGVALGAGSRTVSWPEFENLPLSDFHHEDSIQIK